ncbi:hypothetical protein pipiens_013182 [Culex pipiens pipiens]|uniref:Uncharacterized protein n=1 Tax=Culex pipiens pipiens TaxID=38569 RepID=A0ABD1CZG5_CULPP
MVPMQIPVQILHPKDVRAGSKPPRRKVTTKAAVKSALAHRHCNQKSGFAIPTPAATIKDAFFATDSLGESRIVWT